MLRLCLGISYGETGCITGSSWTSDVSLSKIITFLCNRSKITLSFYYHAFLACHGVCLCDYDNRVHMVHMCTLASQARSDHACLPVLSYCTSCSRALFYKHYYLCCLNYKLDEQLVTLFQYYYIKPSGFWLIT